MEITLVVLHLVFLDGVEDELLFNNLMLQSYLLKISIIIKKGGGGGKSVLEHYLRPKVLLISVTKSFRPLGACASL